MRFRSRILFSVCVVALACLIGEGALRLRQWALHGTWRVPAWLRVSKPTVVWHPFLRATPKPSIRWIEVDGDERALVEINSLGFRSGEISSAKPPGTFRIVCVGSSVVYDTRVPVERSWPMRLQAKLRERFPQHQIEVVNAGIPDRTSADSVVNVALRVLPLSPDVVIVLHGVNDQKPNRYPGFRPDYSHWYPQPERRMFGGVVDDLMDRSLVAARIRYGFRLFCNPRLKENWRGEKLERHDTVAEPGLQAYRRNLETIIGMCRMQDARVIIATAGHSLEENADWNPAMGTRNPLVYYHECLTLDGIKDGFRRYNNANREVAREYGCVLVDLEELLPPGKARYQDDVHFTAAGADKAADIFAAQAPWDTWIGGGG